MGCIALPLTPAQAIDPAQEQACKQAVHDIASALRKGEAGSVVAADFPARDNLLAATAKSDDAPPAMALEIVEIANISFLSADTCKASVSLKANISSTKSTASAKDTETGPLVIRDEWTVQIPPGAGGQPAPAPESWLIGSHVGKVMLRVHLFVPSGTRDELLASQKARDDGLKPSPIDPNAVTLPDQPAAGWYARIGEETTMISANGEFSLSPKEDEKRELEIINPAHGQVYATFPVSSLKPVNGEKPETLVVELAHRGDCGMDHQHGSDPQWCGSAPGASPGAGAPDGEGAP